MTEEKKPRGRPKSTIEVIVMHPNGIQLDSTIEEKHDGYREFRWRGEVGAAEYEMCCKIDDRDRREHRLMKL